MQQSYRHRQIFADSSGGGGVVVVSVATKQFWRLAELREKPLCSRARWLFLSLLPRQRLDCPAAAEPNVPGLALHEPPLRRLEVFFSGVEQFLSWTLCCLCSTCRPSTVTHSDTERLFPPAVTRVSVSSRGVESRNKMGT